jgi:hypothetical protein
MFTGGWLDDPSSVTVTVIVDNMGPATLTADGAFLAAVANASLFTATVSADGAFSGTVAADSSAAAALGAGGELQVQVSKSAIRAIVTCD